MFQLKLCCIQSLLNCASSAVGYTLEHLLFTVVISALPLEAMSMASGSGGGMMQSNPAKLKKSPWPRTQERVNARWLLIRASQKHLDLGHIVCTMRPLRVCIEENSGDISRLVACVVSPLHRLSLLAGASKRYYAQHLSRMQILQ